MLLKNNNLIFKTKLHKPDDPEERKRIYAAGGWVTYWDTARTNGNLAMSRKKL